jgi:hypothetical protein
MKKENNRHAYGKGHGKFGKKADRIARMTGPIPKPKSTQTRGPKPEPPEPTAMKGK